MKKFSLKVFVNIMLIVGVLCAAFKLHDKHSNSQRKGLFEQRGDLTPPQLYIDESKEISRKEGQLPLAIYMPIYIRRKKGNIDLLTTCEKIGQNARLSSSGQIQQSTPII